MKPILREQKSGFNSCLEPKLTELILNSKERKIRWLGLGFTTSFPAFLVLSREGFVPGLWPCPFFHYTGIPCPSCGMTRSLIALAQGDLATSFQYHAFGMVLVAISMITIPQLVAELLLNKLFLNGWLKIIVYRPYQWTLGILFLSYYFLRLILGYPAIFYETFS